LTLDSDQFVQKTIMREINNDENDELQIIDVKDEIEKEKKKKKRKTKLSMRFELRTTVLE